MASRSQNYCGCEGLEKGVSIVSGHKIIYTVLTWLSPIKRVHLNCPQGVLGPAFLGASQEQEGLDYRDACPVKPVLPTPFLLGTSLGGEWRGTAAILGVFPSMKNMTLSFMLRFFQLLYQQPVVQVKSHQVNPPQIGIYICFKTALPNSSFLPQEFTFSLSELYFFNCCA